MEGDKPKRQNFKRDLFGFFQVDIDRMGKFAVTRLAGRAWAFLQHMLETVPYQMHTILTDNVLARERSAV